MDVNSTYTKEMTETEKRVMDVLSKHQAKLDDYASIAKACKISEVQAAVAVQLLKYRNLIPPSSSIQQ